MSRWFRHYVGMQRDPKLVGVAIRTRQSVERVLFVWGCVLESAAEKNAGGSFELDVDELGYFLRCDSSDIETILGEFESVGLLSGDQVTKWGDRQFESDSSAERTRRWRERKRRGDVTVTPCLSPSVTVTTAAEPPVSGGRPIVVSKDHKELKSLTIIPKETVFVTSHAVTGDVTVTPPESESKYTATAYDARAKPDPSPTAHLEAARRIWDVIGIDRDDPTWFGQQHRVAQWIADWDLELDILPTVRRVVARSAPGKIRNLKYFERAIADAKATRTAPLPAGVIDGSKSNGTSNGVIEAADRNLERIRERMRSFSEPPPRELCDRKSPPSIRLVSQRAGE